MSVTRKSGTEDRMPPRKRAEFPRDAPASKKDMKKVWRKDPWHWFYFDPQNVAAEILEKGGTGADFWVNTILSCEAVAMCKKYQVLIKLLPAHPLGEVVHLYITQTNGMKVRPWTDFQRIKNDLCGPTFYGMEAYPPEDELIDDIDMWHLWVFPGGVRMPFWIGNARGDDVQWTFPGMEEKKEKK